MGSIFSQVISLILVAILLFIIPTMYMFQQQEEMVKLLIYNQTYEFVNSVRNIGYITPKMYEDFNKKISSTGNIYQVELEHKHLKIDPVYLDPLDLDTFQGKVKSNYKIINHKTINDELKNKDKFEKYKLSSGDYFKIKIYNKNKTLSTRIKELFLNIKLPSKTIVLTYGGVVKSEVY